MLRRIIILCLFGTVLQIYGASHREVMEQCRAKFPRDSTSADNKKCFAACLLKGIGIMNENNTFNNQMENERIDTMFSDKTAEERQKIKDLVKECSSQSYTGSECDIAGAYKECQKTKAKQAGLDIRPRGPHPHGSPRS